MTQYVVLGAGLDTFAQRRPQIAARLRVFEVDQSAVVAYTGVTMYLSKDATAATLRQIAGLQASEQGARASGTPFVSFYTPADMLDLAREAGFSGVRHVPGSSLAQRYFSERPDGLRPSSGEDLLVASTGEHY